MAIHLQRRLTKFPETWEDINRTTYGIGGEKLEIGYDAPSKLAFNVTAANQTIPFDAYDTFIRWWDDTGTLPDGTTAQDEDHPAFEGWVEEITPGGDTLEVSIVAYDPTFRATRMVQVMSQPWVENPADDEEFPVDGTGAYPRVVVNAHNDADADWTYSIAQGLSLGQIISLLLDYQYLPLLHVGAAPGDGSPQGNELPYDPEELGPSWESSSSSSGSSTSSGAAAEGTLSFVPLEKVIFAEESINSAIDRLLTQWAPEFKCYWEPGTRLWRFVQVTQAPETTITYNDTSQRPYPAGIDVRRSIEQKAGAVKFYGPEGLEWRQYTWTNPDVESSSSDSSVNTLESIDPLATTDGSSNPIKCHQTFRVTDPDFTKMMPRGATPIGMPGIAAYQQDGSGNLVAVTAGPWVETYGPYVMARFKPSAAGDDGWLPFGNWKADFRTGTIRFGSTHCMVRPNPSPESGEAEVQEPWQVSLVTPVLTRPIEVRYPAFGYTGTVTTVGKLPCEKRIYDEQLAVAIVYGTPVTTPVRLSRFRQLARRLHGQIKDIEHVGSIVFDGLDWRWLFLNKRVNLAAKDDNGNALTTGWESIGAFVTSVEYDIENCETTINFSDDQAEVIGLDTNTLKARLKIRDAEWVVRWNLSVFYAYRWITTGTGNRILGQDVMVEATQQGGYQDEYGGEQ